jgi:hypothetical protein
MLWYAYATTDDPMPLLLPRLPELYRSLNDSSRITYVNS